jgi:hypothetical protein
VLEYNEPKHIFDIMQCICSECAKQNREIETIVSERIYVAFHNNKPKMDAMCLSLYNKTITANMHDVGFITFASYSQDFVDNFLECMDKWPFGMKGNPTSLRNVCLGSMLRVNLWSDRDLDILLPAELKKLVLFQPKRLLTLLGTILMRYRRL